MPAVPRSLKPLAGVLFDLNGVIVDDEELHENAFRAALEPFGIELSHDDYLRAEHR